MRDHILPSMLTRGPASGASRVTRHGRMSQTSADLGLLDRGEGSHLQLNPLDSFPHYPWPGGMREAIRRPPGGVLDGGTSKNQSKIFPNLPVIFSPGPSQGPFPGPNIPPGRPELIGSEPF